MNDEDLARGFGLLRAGIGAAMLVAPGLVAASWVGSDGRGAAGRTLARALGAREVALGIGLLRSLEGGTTRDWAAAGIGADAADFAATLIADDMPALGRLGVLGAAGTGVALGLRILARSGR